jgi:hypothetical protein
MPIFLFSVYEAKGDNIVFYILSIVKFIKNRNIYVYEKIIESEHKKADKKSIKNLLKIVKEKFKI